MYPVRGDKDPQVTVISESLVLPPPSSPPLHTPATVPAPTPQLLDIGPAPSPAAPPTLGSPWNTLV
ncbi:hypothetical protein DSO57_1002697 [Entomophthora muscae]|uniref:Uncharacterized protein n=1 Tax=Entomophthora muscae TaxID=34485 RepID=A0ACC2UIB2_9FUNG|nr:hypothetical protein DSO57_1002697 [Entomophthora muscae]